MGFLGANTNGVISKEKGVPATVERALLILTLAFAVGIATGVYLSFPAGPLLIAAALVFARLFLLLRVENLREHGQGWFAAGGLQLLVFLGGMAYVTVRQSAAQGTLTALVEGPTSQAREATLEGPIIREPDVREDRAAYIVRAQAAITRKGSPRKGGNTDLLVDQLIRGSREFGA